MDRMLLGMIAGALMVGAAGCAGPAGTGAADVSGDERGGKVPYAEGKVPAAMNAAQMHCGRFGKKAQVIRMTPAAQGGEIGFECR